MKLMASKRHSFADRAFQSSGWKRQIGRAEPTALMTLQSALCLLQTGRRIDFRPGLLEIRQFAGVIFGVVGG
jgi:hypothetical protein